MREGVGETGEKERKEERGIRAKKDGTQTKRFEVYTMYLGRLAAALMTLNTPFPLECSACRRDWRTCPTDNILSTDHIHVPCTLLFAHVAHSIREDIHVHVHREGEEAGWCRS